jgi:hypothetical protein
MGRRKDFIKMDRTDGSRSNGIPVNAFTKTLPKLYAFLMALAVS